MAREEDPTTLIRKLSLALIIAGSVACRSGQTFSCEPSVTARAPRNLGVVLSADGLPTPIYRGGQPTECAELSFLKSLGVKSILKLNDRGLPIDAAERENAAALGLHVESFNFNPTTIGGDRSCDEVRRALAFLKDPAHWPVYVHCTAGKDRTGYIVGIYERATGRATTDVIGELNAYGHRGIRSIAMSQIDRELSRPVPTCLQAASSSSPDPGSTSVPRQECSDRSSHR